MGGRCWAIHSKQVLLKQPPLCYSDRRSSSSPLLRTRFFKQLICFFIIICNHILDLEPILFVLWVKDTIKYLDLLLLEVLVLSSKYVLIEMFDVLNLSGMILFDNLHLLVFEDC